MIGGEFMDKTNNNQLIQNPKIGKNKMLIGFLMMLSSVVLFSIGGAIQSGVPGTFGGLMIMAGLIVFAIGKFQHWYHWK